LRPADRLDCLERRQPAPLDAGQRRRQTGQRDDLAVVERADVDDPPARASHLYEIARPRVAAAFNRIIRIRLRNLHRVSAARSAENATREWRVA
jgi:hypothetical protein